MKPYIKKSTKENSVENILTTAPTNVTPAELIMAAVSGQADLDKVEKLLSLQERWEANQARKVFALAFSEVQEKISAVVKTKINPQTQSKYADLSNVIESAKPVYTKYGFSVIFYEGDTPLPEHVRIYADVLHSAGHKETYHYDVPMDGVGIKGNANMTKIHAKASSISYGRRYLMCMIWNIPTADDDGNKASTITLITDKQLRQLRDILIAKEVADANIAKLMEYLKVESLEDLPANDFMKALTAVNGMPGKKAGAK